MTTPLLCLLLYTAWAILLVLSIGLWRIYEVVAGTKAANEFPAGTQHGSDLYWRLNRAHLNVVENLPIFGAVVIATHLANETAAWVATACIVVVVARVAQSLIHISSSTPIAASLRFTAFLTQVAAIGYVIVRLVF